MELKLLRNLQKNPQPPEPPNAEDCRAASQVNAATSEREVGFGVQDLGFRVLGVQDLGFRV